MVRTLRCFAIWIGFKPTRSDSSLFVLRHGNDIAYILLYVDDIVLTSSSSMLLHQLLSQLQAEFAIKDLGDLHFFLGIDVKRTTDGFFLSQQWYADDILERAGMTNCKPSSTPIDIKGKLSADGATIDDAKQYRSLAGALQYLTVTRPDLTFAVQQACLHMHDPRAPHQALLKRILRYVYGTSEFGLWLHGSPDMSITAYSNAVWAGCPDTRRSTSGFCIILGDALVSWSSKQQPTVSPVLARRPSIGPLQTPQLSASGSDNFSANFSVASTRLQSPTATTFQPSTCLQTQCITSGPNISSWIFILSMNGCSWAICASFMYLLASSMPMS